MPGQRTGAAREERDRRTSRWRELVFVVALVVGLPACGSTVARTSAAGSGPRGTAALGAPGAADTQSATDVPSVTVDQQQPLAATGSRASGQAQRGLSDAPGPAVARSGS